MDIETIKSQINKFTDEKNRLLAIILEKKCNINDLDTIIDNYKCKLYMTCEHNWKIDASYGPYDKEYYCSKCGLYKDFNLEQKKYDLKLKSELEKR